MLTCNKGKLENGTCKDLFNPPFSKCAVSGCCFLHSIRKVIISYCQFILLVKYKIIFVFVMSKCIAYVLLCDRGGEHLAVCNGFGTSSKRDLMTSSELLQKLQ